MLFCSVEFMVFFAVLLMVYWSIPWRRARVWLLLIASFCFYASWNKWLAIIICVSTVLDYLLALGMEHSTESRRRKLLLAVSVVANLGLLCYFKYVNFFLGSLNEGLFAAGSPLVFRSLKVILPIGISFYTFEAINYTVDVYRRKIPAERNLSDFMLFILFFPHLVAGPIVRARDFLPQIKRPKRCDWVRLHLGRSISSWAYSRSWPSPTAWPSSPIRCSTIRWITARRPPGSPCSPTPCRCTAISPVTPTWPSVRRTCSATSWPRTSTCRTCRPTSPSSGTAGTSRCPPGCAITCSSRWAAAAAVNGRPVAICSSP